MAKAEIISRRQHVGKYLLRLLFGRGDARSGSGGDNDDMKSYLDSEHSIQF